MKIFKIGGICDEEEAEENDERLPRKFFEIDDPVIEESSSSSLNPSYPARSDNDPFYDSLEENISDLNPHLTSKDETKTTTTTPRTLKTTMSTLKITTTIPTTVPKTTKLPTKSPVTTQSWVPISTLANQSIWPKPPGYNYVSTQTAKQTVTALDIPVTTSQIEETILSTSTIWPKPSDFVPLLTEKNAAKVTIKTPTSEFEKSTTTLPTKLTTKTTESATTTTETQTSTLWPHPSTPEIIATVFPPPEATRQTEPPISWPTYAPVDPFSTIDPLNQFPSPTTKRSTTRETATTTETETTTEQNVQGWSEWTACECSMDGGTRTRKFTCLQADYSVSV